MFFMRQEIWDSRASRKTTEEEGGTWDEIPSSCSFLFVLVLMLLWFPDVFFIAVTWAKSLFMNPKSSVSQEVDDGETDGDEGEGEDPVSFDTFSLSFAEKCVVDWLLHLWLESIFVWMERRGVPWQPRGTSSCSWEWLTTLFLSGMSSLGWCTFSSSWFWDETGTTMTSFFSGLMPEQESFPTWVPIKASWQMTLTVGSKRILGDFFPEQRIEEELTRFAGEDFAWDASRSSYVKYFSRREDGSISWSRGLLSDFLFIVVWTTKLAFWSCCLVISSISSSSV